jgi:hypothetical protein
MRAWLPAFISLVLTACSGTSAAPGASDGGTDAACPIRTRLSGPASELGDDGKLFFSFFSYLSPGQLDGSTDFELAAGGSVTTVLLEARGIAPSGLTVKSVGAAPATVTIPSPQTEGGCNALLVVNVTTGAAGTFDLVVDDANGAEYDRKTFTSVQPAHLGFADSWPSPTQVFVGSTQLAHADTLGPHGEELRGTGAVHFTLSGALVSAPAPSDGDPGGDIIYFSSAGLGVGQVSAVADGYAEQAAVSVVDGSAITDVVLANAGSGTTGTVSGPAVSVEGRAGADLVYGAECLWKTTAQVTELWPSALGRASQAIYIFEGPPGPVTATCTILGGPSASITVELPAQ